MSPRRPRGGTRAPQFRPDPEPAERTTLGGCIDCPVWAEQAGLRSDPRAGSEGAGPLRWGVRLRLGRVGGVLALAPATVCPGGDAFASSLRVWPGPGEGAEYGSWGAEILEGGAGVRSRDPECGVGVARPGVREGRGVPGWEWREGRV